MRCIGKILHRKIHRTNLSERKMHVGTSVNLEREYASWSRCINDIGQMVHYVPILNHVSYSDGKKPAVYFNIFFGPKWLLHTIPVIQC